MIFSKMVMTIQYSENLSAQIANLGAAFEETPPVRSDGG